MAARARRARPRRWRVTRTLSGRLIAGLVALLALACATVGVVTYLAFQRNVSRELNNQLQAATSVANNCLDSWLGYGYGDGDHDSDDHAAPGAGSPQAPQGAAAAPSAPCPATGSATARSSRTRGLACGAR